VQSSFMWFSSASFCDKMVGLSDSNSFEEADVL
jgi:hypothetical protein